MFVCNVRRSTTSSMHFRVTVALCGPAYCFTNSPFIAPRKYNICIYVSWNYVRMYTMVCNTTIVWKLRFSICVHPRDDVLNENWWSSTSGSNENVCPHPKPLIVACSHAKMRSVSNLQQLLLYLCQTRDCGESCFIWLDVRIELRHTPNRWY